MEQAVSYVTNLIHDEVLRGKVLIFSYMIFAGLFQVSKANFSWWLSAIVGLLAAANYIDQMIQRRKNKKS